MRLGLGRSGRPRLASGLWGAPPASNPWPLPPLLPLPRCHMKRGLQVGGPPITQHRCGERPLPRHAADSRLLAQETGCVLALWRRKLPGTGHRVWTVRCGVEAALGGVWARPTSRAPQRGLADGLGPEVPHVSSMTFQVCVCVCVCCRRGWQVPLMLPGQGGASQRTHKSGLKGWRV